MRTEQEIREEQEAMRSWTNEQWEDYCEKKEQQKLEEFRIRNNCPAYNPPTFTECGECGAVTASYHTESRCVCEED